MSRVPHEWSARVAELAAVSELEAAACVPVTPAFLALTLDPGTHARTHAAFVRSVVARLRRWRAVADLAA